MSNPRNNDSRHIQVVAPVDPLYAWLSDVSEDPFDERELDEVLRQGKETPDEEALFDMDICWAKIKRSASKSQQQRSRFSRLRALLITAVVVAFSIGLLTAQAMGVVIFGSIVHWTEQVFWFDQPPVMVDVSPIGQRVELWRISDKNSCLETAETDDFTFRASFGDKRSNGSWYRRNPTTYEKDSSVTVLEGCPKMVGSDYVYAGTPVSHLFGIRRRVGPQGLYYGGCKRIY